MRIASLRSKNKHNRNGELIVVSRDHQRAFRVDPSVSILTALQNWGEYKNEIKKIYEALNEGNQKNAFDLDLDQCQAPITNGPGFYDGSAFLSHVVRARRARGDQMPESAKVTPLMYQGVSDNQLSWNAPLKLLNPAYGGDFEGEFAVIVDDVPAETKPDQMDKHILFLSLFNDITYREIVKVEIETKFGFLQSKPNSSFAPILVSPDEFGSDWQKGRLHLDMLVELNGKSFGHPNGKEMHFSFQELVAHACRTRPLSAGCVIGCGTISNESVANGFACLTEKRFQEIIDTGKPITPWLKVGDEVVIDVKKNGQSVFGEIRQRVEV
jgi:fumarylacetoacetate (FAA) hydrolase